jgi:hypothetical protein
VAPLWMWDDILAWSRCLDRPPRVLGVRFRAGGVARGRVLCIDSERHLGCGRWA